VRIVLLAWTEGRRIVPYVFCILYFHLRLFLQAASGISLDWVNENDHLAKLVPCLFNDGGSLWFAEATLMLYAKLLESSA
jgi:hypothetical protein